TAAAPRQRSPSPDPTPEPPRPGPSARSDLIHHRAALPRPRYTSTEAMLHEPRRVRSPISANSTTPAVSSPTPAAHLRPGIAQPDGAVEHGAAGPRVRIAAKVTLPFELHRLDGIAGSKRGLDPAIAEHFKRIGVE